jgi:hypothetical protein
VLVQRFTSLTTIALCASMWSTRRSFTTRPR